MRSLKDYDPEDLAEVEDVTVTFPVPTPSAQPATVTYTVRPRLGDSIYSNGAVILITFAPRDVELRDGATKRMDGDKIEINLIQTCMVSRRVRLKPKTRPSIKAILDPEGAALDQIRELLLQIRPH